MATYLAQTLKLDNTKHNDIEVIIYCEQFEELKGLLEDPLYHIQHSLGPMWQHNDWAMIAPITIILSSEEAGLGNINLSVNHVRSIKGEGVLENGEWIALFSLNTHLLRIHYSVPASLDEREKLLAKIDFGYTVPNIFFSGEYDSKGDIITGRGTLHFDLSITNPSEVNERRAVFVMNHLLNGQKCTCENLDHKPIEILAKAGIPPGKPPVLQTSRPILIERTYMMNPIVPPIVIMEGLSVAPNYASIMDDPETPLVCVQSGCVWVPAHDGIPAHWELDHVAVKNYVEPNAD